MKKPLYVFIHPETLLQALLLHGSPNAWLRAHCRHGHCRPVSTPACVRRIDRALHDPVFQLTERDRMDLYSEFLPRMDILPAEQLVRRANIVVNPDVLFPGFDEDEQIAYVSPDFYKSLVGLDE